MDDAQASTISQLLIAQCPLSLPGWVEFNCRKWGLSAERLSLAHEGKPLPSVEAVFYANRRGQLVTPPLNPFLPVVFTPTSAASLPKLYRQWLSIGGLLAQNLRKRRFANILALHPGITDVRPFHWAGLRTSVRYTFHIPLPADFTAADNDTRRRSRIAHDAGYTCTIASDVGDLYKCLAGTENRQEFEHDLALHDLQLALDLLGPEHLRMYVCYDPQQTPVSAMMVLHAPGCWAIDLAAGTVNGGLTSGAVQLVTQFCLEDLAQAGACGFDFAGANLERIAAAKMQWGGNLIPYYTIEQHGLRSILRHMRAWTAATK